MNTSIPHFDRETLIWNAAIPPEGKLLLLALNSLSDGEGCAPRNPEKLSKMMNLTVPDIKEFINTLKGWGIVSESTESLTINFHRLS